MKKLQVIFLALIIFIYPVLNTGCWNYKEVDKFSIVAGIAIDKGENNQFKITAEIIQITGGKESKTSSKVITMEGKTMFDAVRNMISLSGKRLYWSHTKVIIVSKEIAKEGLIRVIDWYNRDSETREDVNILVSEGASAQEILSSEATTEDVLSFVLSDILKNQVSLSKASKTDILEFDIQSQVKESSLIIPTVSLKQINGKKVPHIAGTAIIKNNKLIGFLNGEETKELLMVRNEVKGGVIVEEIQEKNVVIPFTLEIFKSKTKVTPIINDKKIEMNLDIKTTVAIDELEGSKNLFTETGLEKIQKSTEAAIKNRIEDLIKKINNDYSADIFKFGSALWENKPRVWKSVRKNWQENLKNLKVNVKVTIAIKNSGHLSNPIEVGD